MSEVVIKLENVSKQYRLGEFGTGTLSHDLNRWWHRVRGKEDPYLKIGAVNDRATTDGEEYVWALHDINLEVKQGEVLGIIGKNGAGKSTLLKLLSRVTAPTTGRIMAKGRVASLLEVGTGFHPELTGKENIYLNGAILGMTKAEVSSKLDEIVEFAGVARYLDTPVKRYSSGMKVRLGFAVAAHLDPEILIVDEVLAVGDAAFQKQAIGKIRDVSQGEGRTIFFVSHNMASIRHLCAKTVLLKDGQLSDYGPTDEIVDSYLSEASELAKDDIAGRKDRTGNKAILVTEVQLKSQDTNLPLHAITPGMDIEFHIHFELNEDVSERGNVELEFGLAIYNSRHQFLTVLNNKMSGSSIYSNEGLHNGIVACAVNRFPLMPGKYFVRTMAKYDNKIGDILDQAFSFEVLNGDFFLSGKPNDRGRQGVYIPQNWRKAEGL